MNHIGKLYLIPCPIGEVQPGEVLPDSVLRALDFIFDFVVENEKAARKFIKSAKPEKPQSELRIRALDKHEKNPDYASMLAPVFEGRDLGVISDAGCPGVADPGADIVRAAHQLGIQVVPLVGPSSILLALMASGMNGQRFAFHGYLPIDKSERKNMLKLLEKRASDYGESQIFIETPYRNNKLAEDLQQFLSPSTLLCIAADLTLPEEFVKTLPIASWRGKMPDLQNRPAIFILYTV